MMFTDVLKQLVGCAICSKKLRARIWSIMLELLTLVCFGSKVLACFLKKKFFIKVAVSSLLRISPLRLLYLSFLFFAFNCTPQGLHRLRISLLARLSAASGQHYTKRLQTRRTQKQALR